MEKEKIVRFRDLSPLLKIAVIYILLHFGFLVAYLLLMALIGIASVS